MTTGWLKWDSLPDVPDDKPYAKWRASAPKTAADTPRYVVRGTETGVEISDSIAHATKRLRVAEFLAIDTIIEAHEGRATVLQVTEYPTPIEYDPGNAISRRTRVMAGDVVLGSVVVRRCGEYAYEAVTE
jgi:hypothetical protein